MVVAKASSYENWATKEESPDRMKLRLAPQTLVTLSSILLLCAIVLASVIATRQPWLGLSLSPTEANHGLKVSQVNPKGPAAEFLRPGETLFLLAGQPPVRLGNTDIAEEPDAVSLYADYNRFFEKQTKIHQLLSAGKATLILDNQLLRLDIKDSRPLSDLPFLFWFQISCASIIFIAGMSVYAYRREETVTKYYALTGFGLLITILPAAIYSTRELAFDGELFYTLSLLNQLGTYVFAGPFVAILWEYPTRIHRFPMGPLLIVVFLFVWLANALQIVDSIDLMMRYPIIVGLMFNLSFAAIQWRRSKHNPVTRAILKWFLLAWLTGTTLFVGFNITPLILGYEPILSQSLGWGVLLTVYLGIALGITRYRLFNLDRWVVIGWFWFIGGLAVIGLDFALVYLLNIENQLSLAISLALAGWLYFPLRQQLWHRLSIHRRGASHQELLPELLTSVLSSQSKDLSDDWKRLLKRLFAPLQIEHATQTTHRLAIEENGLLLYVPAFATLPPLQLTGAERGNRLFNPEDIQLVQTVHLLFRKLLSYRNAFKQGAEDERKRLARDLHDDVGAKLLTLVYSADSEENAELARTTLHELRSVISGLESSAHNLISALGNWRIEASSRCQTHNIDLQWLQDMNIPDLKIDARKHINLQRVLREAITNAIKHGHAKSLRVEISLLQQALRFHVSNEGIQCNLGPIHIGRGLRNMRTRVEELEGTIEWSFGTIPDAHGCTVNWLIPLDTKVSS